MPDRPTVLVIDDHPNMLRMMRSVLDKEFVVRTYSGGREALEAFRTDPADIVVTDIRMPDVGGMDVLREIKACREQTEVVLMTAYGEVSQAVEALRDGAYDYLLKPFEPDEMLLTLRKAAERQQLRARAERLQHEVESRFGFATIVGQSKTMRPALELAHKAAESDIAVLLTGESGTGKEVFARAIHYASSRSEGAFVAINCAAIPKDLIESELFGHVRGAFSGALREKPGLFEQADGGTLLLDEITELGADVQAKINRALQEGEVRRVGDTKDRKVTVRVIACTNRDLQEAMSSGEFRQDLYFRLNVFPIHLPPLRDRDGDVPLLVAHFLREFAGDSTDQYTVEPKAMDKLCRYAWPGNVRELRNCIERAIVLCEGKRITEDLFSFRVGAQEAASAGTDVPIELPYREAMDRITNECLRSYVLGVLRAYEGNVTKAAEHAGVERESFHRLMRKCEVSREDI